MCGISGFIDFKKQHKESDVASMASCLQHRGPDGGSTWFAETQSATIGLGHRRLSIIDLSETANQPMHFDGLHVVFNGEIYNSE